jgi:hypothetical protein
VSSGRGEDARDAEDEGIHAVPGQTIAGWWSLWPSWLRPPHGLSSEWPLCSEPGEKHGVCDADLAPEVHNRETASAQELG